MPDSNRSKEEQACLWARTAAGAFSDSAEYLASLPDSAWEGPTGAEKWNMRVLAGHIAGKAVWFPNLIQVAVRGDSPVPAERYEEIKGLSPAGMAAIISDAASRLEPAVGGAIPSHLETPLDLGWMKMPLWSAVSISMFEAVFHNWDARARRDADPTIPVPWAVALAGPVTNAATGFAHRTKLAGADGVFLLQVRDGVGPVTVSIGDGKITVESLEADNPDLVLHLTADQYVRLLAGRCPLSGTAGRSIVVQGDHDKALALNRVFGGIANQ